MKRIPKRTAILLAILILSLVVLLREEILWKVVSLIDIIPNYESYLTFFPSGKYEKMAKSRIDTVSFEIAKSENTPEAYTRYLERFPSAKHRKEAENTLDTLMFEIAKSEDTKEAYRTYLSESPVCIFKDGAINRIEILMFNKIKEENTAKAYEKYLSVYPSGSFTAVAQNALDILTFKKALRENHIKAFKNYVEKYPSGIYSQIAKGIIKSPLYEKSIPKMLGVLTYKELENKTIEPLILSIISYINTIQTVGLDSVLVSKYAGKWSRSRQSIFNSSRGPSFSNLFRPKNVSIDFKDSFCYEELIIDDEKDDENVIELIPKYNGNVMRGTVDFNKKSIFEKYKALGILKTLLSNDSLEEWHKHYDWKNKRPRNLKISFEIGIWKEGWLPSLIEETMIELILNDRESVIIKYQAMGILANLHSHELFGKMVQHPAHGKNIVDSYNEMTNKLITEAKNIHTAKRATTFLACAVLFKKYVDSVKASCQNSSYSSHDSTCVRQCEDLYESLLKLCKPVYRKEGILFEHVDSPHYQCLKKAKEARSECMYNCY
jgi:hypothetical protein